MAPFFSANFSTLSPQASLVLPRKADVVLNKVRIYRACLTEALNTIYKDDYNVVIYTNVHRRNDNGLLHYALNSKSKHVSKRFYLFMWTLIILTLSPSEE